MGRRSVSPTPSVQGFDISGALAGDFDGETGGVPGSGNFPTDILDGILPGPDGDSDNDDLYIAAQQAASNRRNAKAAGPKKGGSFQSFGLNPTLAKAISGKGFKIPTPIQRKTIPIILDGQDVVGMARTGSGKTAAFVIPMLEKLKAHSAKVGARGIILSPSRELALQTLKVVKELGRGTDLRTILLVGGDSLEEQFSSMASNPDIIIATPGRFEHLKVEMGLELSSVKYVVFDEADRLFEMGFAAQLTEIITSLPPNRQTLLFSATLPKSLVEFARAGLQEPKLVRLDSESKVSPDLQSAFFMVNTADKEGALLHILRDVIKMPGGLTEAAIKARDKPKDDSKKRKRGADRPSATETPTPHSTIVFAATKHHVDYLATLLKLAGYATSYVYGSLDQTARKMQVEDFRTGMTNILVVTDVAARGIDIPILANVINYDLPPQPKVFVHRVGRTARAGRTGWSYNFVTAKDLPYLVDLQLFLGGKLILGRENHGALDYHSDITLGSLSRQAMEPAIEDVTKILSEDSDLAAQKDVAEKGEKQYLRTRNSASAESAKRARAVATSTHLKDLHPLFEGSNDADMDAKREEMLARVSGFRPSETIFEVGRRGQLNEAAEIIKKRRSRITAKAEARAKDAEMQDLYQSDDEPTLTHVDAGSEDADAAELESDSDMEVTITQPSSKRSKADHSFADSEHFMGYLPTSTNFAEDAGYSVNPSGAGAGSFLTAARSATLDLAADESSSYAAASKPTGLRWDKKSKRYVARANDLDGSRAQSKTSKSGGMIKSESGLKIPASMKSGRFEAWKKANRVGGLPRVGELEKPGQNRAVEKKWRHRKVEKPKELDRYRDDYHVKKKRMEEREKAAREGGGVVEGKGRGKKGGAAKKELRGVDDVRKLRNMKEKRKEKNARPKRRGRD